MKKLIYYPGFDIQNQEWLKFSLLYIDKLCPIVPYNAREHVDKSTKMILNNTDLLEQYHPNYDIADRASVWAMQQLDSIINNPERYANIFRSRNIVETLRDPISHTVLLFSQKYSYNFKRYCKNYGFATETNSGIYINSYLSEIYMSILANEISEAVGVDCITDSNRRLNYNLFLKNVNAHANYNEVELFQSIIPLYLPSKLSDIPIENIIELRNKPSFKDNMTAFHDVIERYLSQDLNGNAIDFKYWFDESSKNIKAHFLFEFGPELTGVGLTALTTANLLQVNPFLGIGITSASLLYKMTRDSSNVDNRRNYRRAKKYCTNLSRLL